jgi:hypothetical protein
MSIRRIRRAVRDGRYEVSVHALDEMDEDDLTDAHVHRVVLRGTLMATLTDDPRGPRFVVRGTPTETDAEVEVVCRFLPSGRMRIITVYVVKDERL